MKLLYYWQKSPKSLHTQKSDDLKHTMDRRYSMYYKLASKVLEYFFIRAI